MFNFKMNFSKSEIAHHIDSATEETWSKDIQDATFNMMLSRLNESDMNFTTEQEKALKDAFVFSEKLATKQSLSAATNLLEKLGLINLN